MTQPSPAERGAPSLYYLRTFHTVATERSFTRAGRELGLSQPGVSAHVRALERYWGVRLFDVRRKRVYLTTEGEVLLQYTRRIFALLGQADRAVTQSQQLERGRIVCAASETAGTYLLPRALAAFRPSHPWVDLAVWIGTTPEVVARVLADQSPCGVIEAPASHPDLDVRPLLQDDLALIVPAGHPWAAESVLPLERLDGVPLMRREVGSATGALVERALAQARVQMPASHVWGSMEALKQAVVHGLGIAWVPRSVVRQEIATGLLASMRVQGLAIQRTVSAVTPRGGTPAPLLEAFFATLAALSSPLEAAAPPP